MKTLTIILFLFNLAYCQVDHGKGQIKINDDLYCTQIVDSVYMYTHYFPTASNGMFVLLPDSEGLLINTPCENTGTMALLDWIEKSFGRLRLIAIVTGFHQDNLGGDEILLSRNIPVYGADLTVKLVKDKGAELKNVILSSVSSAGYKRYYDSYMKLNLIPPNKTFPIGEGMELRFRDETFEVYFPGESHTIDNTVVYLQRRKILFGGCMIKGMEFDNPGYTGYANMAEWPVSVKKVMDRFTDCKVVVPGHGRIGGKELLPHMIALLNEWNNKHEGQK